jgi:hypothetical protein
MISLRLENSKLYATMKTKTLALKTVLNRMIFSTSDPLTIQIAQIIGNGANKGIRIDEVKQNLLKFAIREAVKQFSGSERFFTKEGLAIATWLNSLK